jgi:hypothetical protein
MVRPEDLARQDIDRALGDAGWSVQGGPDLDPDAEAPSQFGTLDDLRRDPVPVTYNPALPVELFDVIVVDECHRSIYSLWRQVLEYFDAYLVGLTATPSKQTYGFFHKNLVMEYGHAEAVADAVNVDFDVYKIRTRITDQGAKLEAGPAEIVGRRDRETRAVRWERLDADLTYDADALDRTVVAPDPHRRPRLPRQAVHRDLPGRTDGPAAPTCPIWWRDPIHRRARPTNLNLTRELPPRIVIKSVALARTELGKVATCRFSSDKDSGSWLGRALSGDRGSSPARLSPPNPS